MNSIPWLSLYLNESSISISVNLDLFTHAIEELECQAAGLGDHWVLGALFHALFKARVPSKSMTILLVFGFI